MTWLSGVKILIQTFNSSYVFVNVSSKFCKLLFNFRSGKYVYKPTMNQTCCPQYTIRCEALNFKLRKSHKKVLKRVNKYLIHGIKPSAEKGEELEDNDDEDNKGKGESDEKQISEGSNVSTQESEIPESSGTSTVDQSKTPRKGST